jgi:transcription termination/antitermination protein NusG
MIENLHQDFQPAINTGLVCPDAPWYAVQTMPRHEKKVSAELAAKDIDCFLPTVSKLRQWSDRKQIIVEPLFAGYVFARLVADSSARIALLRTSGVVGLVGVRGVGVPIPETEINSIHKILEARRPFALHRFIKVGKRVRVRGGSLDGLEGILQSINGDESLVVSVELIQRSLAMTISGYTVEPVLQSNEAVPVLRAAQR